MSNRKLQNLYVINAFFESSEDMDWVWNRTIDRMKLSGKKIEGCPSMTAVPPEYADDVNQCMNAAERALKRIDARADDSPYGEDLRIGMEFAADVLREELGRFHGE